MPVPPFHSNTTSSEQFRIDMLYRQNVELEELKVLKSQVQKNRHVFKGIGYDVELIQKEIDRLIKNKIHDIDSEAQKQ